MPGAHVLAIDQGTTGSTALVVDADARVVGRGYAEFPQHYPRPGWVEHDPVDLWQVSLDVAGAALAAAGVGVTDIAALGITNQRETTVLWDRASGDPVHNAIVWQDRRTASQCDELRARGLAPMIRERTGLVLDAYFSGTKVAWLLDNVKDLRRRAEQGEIAFGTVDSWLVHRLTDGTTHATDVTNASRTMLFDIRSLSWDDELLEAIGVPRGVLPEVRPSLAEYGVTRALGGELPVAAILGDQQAALFAQACYRAGQAKNTYGTGSFVLMNSGTRAVVDQDKLVATIAVGVEGEGTQYALEGPIFATGSAVQWLRDELRIIDSAAASEPLAMSVPDTGDVWFVPALTGLGAPQWDSYARGALIGVTRGTSRAHIVRAVLESIAWLTRDVVETMQQEAGVPIDELRVDGGAVANRFLMQFQADVLGIPVDVPEQTESTSLGSAFAAGVTAGLWRDRDELARARRTAARYEPTMSEDERDTRYARWRQAVQRSLAWAEA